MTRVNEPFEITDEEKSLQEQIHNLQIQTFNKFKLTDLALILAGEEASHIAVRKFEALDTLLTTAHYYLLDGSRFDHKVYCEKDGVQTYNKHAQYQYILHNLKSAVVWYNSSIDYILQIIYFGFGFYQHFTTVSKSEHKNHYQKEERSARLSNKEFMKKFDEISASNQYAKELQNRWKQLSYGCNAVKIRELANSIKHHSGFELVETATATHHKISIYGICWEEVAKIPTIGYTELLKHLIGLHNEVASFEEYLYNALGFSAISDQIKLGKTKITPLFYYQQQA